MVSWMAWPVLCITGSPGLVKPFFPLSCPSWSFGTRNLSVKRRRLSVNRLSGGGGWRTFCGKWNSVCRRWRSVRHSWRSVFQKRASVCARRRTFRGGGNSVCRGRSSIRRARRSGWAVRRAVFLLTPSFPSSCLGMPLSWKLRFPGGWRFGGVHSRGGRGVWRLAISSFAFPREPLCFRPFSKKTRPIPPTPP